MLYLTIFPCNTNQNCFSPKAKQKKNRTIHLLDVSSSSVCIEILMLGVLFLNLGVWTTTV